MDKTCSLCGVIISFENEMCETCTLMMTGNSNPPENTSSASLDNFTEQIETNQNYLPQENIPNQFGHSVEEPAIFVSPMMSATDTVSPDQPLTQTFAPPPPRRMPPPRPFQPAEKEYKPSLWYWISELPAFVKIIAVVLVFAVGFAVVLKGFTKLDVSVVSANPNLEPQKPWFSAWFRSNPTGEEIFEKYEKETFAKGKNLTAESFLITGKAEFLEPGAKGISKLAEYRKPQTDKTPAPALQVTPPPKNLEAPVRGLPKPSDFKVTFEISIKKPNKFLMKMVMKPKEGFNQSYANFPTMGFDGKKGWAFMKTFYNGNYQTNESKAPNANYFLKQNRDGVAMTFLRSSYSTAELQGQEDVLNRMSYSVKTTDLAGKEATIFFDIETGLASKVSENGVDMYILDYTNFDGTMFPSKVVYIGTGDWLMLTMEQLKSNVPLDDSIFERSSY